MFSSYCFRLPKYEPNHTGNCGMTKYVAVCNAKKYSMVHNFLGMFQFPFLKRFPNFLSYNNSKNTQKYGVLFKDIIEYVMET